MKIDKARDRVAVCTLANLAAQNLRAAKVMVYPENKEFFRGKARAYTYAAKMIAKMMGI